jgi:hypothetical protein
MNVHALVAYDSEKKNDFNIVIQSLNQCQPQPTSICILNNGKLPQSLKKKPRVHIYKSKHRQIKPIDVFDIVPHLDRKEKNYILIVTPNNRYPIHLIEEYLTFVPKMEESLIKQKPDFKGSIYGLSGLFMVCDKKKLMDKELEYLEKGIDVPTQNQPNALGYINQNALVEVLEMEGTIFFNLDIIQSEWFQLDTKTRNINNSLLLSNILSKHNILRSQICNLTFNRHVLIKMGFFQNSHKEPEKTDDYLSSLASLKSKEKPQESSPIETS